MTRRFASLAIFLAMALAAHAAEVTGTVTNRTTGKPAAGDVIILLKLAQGMEEAARGRTDAQGRFRLALDDAGAPHLLRVVHQEVTYHKQLPPGMVVADVDVFDAAAKVAGVRTSMNIIRLEPQAGQLNVTELYAVKNESNPPRSQMSNRTFSITLPAAAKIDTAAVASTGGMPISASPIPGGRAGEYGFMFPLRPGETRFQIGYHLPYSGSIEWKPAVAGALEHLVVMVPPGVGFIAADPGMYSSMPDEQGATVRVATSVEPKQNVAFTISGTGAFPAEGPGTQAAAGREAPGGGIGRPIESPNPLQQHMWWILGGFVVLLAAGAWWFYKQPALAETSSAAPPFHGAASFPRVAARQMGSSALLLDALKEELFALESDRAAGRISTEDYRRHKDALDLTLARALARQK